MSRIPELIVKNFWFRNIVLFLLLATLEQLFRPEIGIGKVITGYLISLGIYLWFIFHNLFLLEKLLFKKRPFLYFLGFLIGLVYYALIMYSNNGMGYSSSILAKGSLIAGFNTFAGTLFYFTYKYLKEQQDFARNKVYLLEMEQKYLKNQLSPHFLFNTLNNIYSYSLIDSKKTPELILKLSELMRYLTQFNKMDKITLREELLFIENYIAFERERLEDRCTIVFDKELSNENIIIEPLLFFPLIENAFKHGTNTMDDCYVTIRINEKNNELNVYIENKIYHTKNPSTNSGIENVEKRLKLFYDNSFKLNVSNKNGIFTSELIINLEQNEIRNEKN